MNPREKWCYFFLGHGLHVVLLIRASGALSNACCAVNTRTIEGGGGGGDHLWLIPAALFLVAVSLHGHRLALFQL